MRKIIGLILLALFVITSSCGDDDKKLAPLIVNTVPINNQKNVDPDLTKIEITFYDDIEIAAKNAFSLNGTIVEATMEGSKGFTVNVGLEPDTEYKFSIPAEKIRTKGSDIYMKPYTLTFRTAE